MKQRRHQQGVEPLIERFGLVGLLGPAPAGGLCRTCEKTEREMASEVEISQPYSPPSWRQLGVFVLDGSNSMNDQVERVSAFTGTKAEAVNAAIQQLINRFKISEKLKNFSFAVVKFHDTISEVLLPKEASDMETHGNYDPTSAGTGGTFIGAGLEKAKEICDQFFRNHQDDLPTSAVILLLSDGQCLQAERTRSIAAEIAPEYPRIKLAAAFFATKGKPSEGYDLLVDICSDPQKFCTNVYDPETLRDFFERSLTE